MNHTTLSKHYPRDIDTVMLNERQRIIKEVSHALIFCMRLTEDPYLALRLNSAPSKNIAEAVTTFVREQTCALSNVEMVQGFDVIQERLSGRISDLYDGCYGSN